MEKELYPILFATVCGEASYMGGHADLFTALTKSRHVFFKERKCLSFCIQQFNFADTKTFTHKLTEHINYNPWLYEAFNADTNRQD